MEKQLFPKHCKAEKLHRQSCFELLRIVAMLFIIVHHHLTNVAQTCGYDTLYDYNKDGIAGVIINGSVVGGVNLFVMISGYFGVRHTLRKLLKLFIDVIFFGSIAYLISLLFLPYTFSISSLFASIDFRYYWFVTHYVILVLIAPILEYALKGQNSIVVGKWVLIFFVINVIFGFFLEESTLLTGYNYTNFVLLYLMARYIRLIKEERKKIYINICAKGMFYWIICSLLLSLGLIFLCKIHKVPASIHYFGYNNPILLFACFFLFTYFTKFSFYSRTINWLATGMFGVYLMHTSYSLGKVWHGYASIFYIHFGYAGLIASSILLLAILSFFAIFIEKFTSVIDAYIFDKVHFLLKNNK